MPAPQTPTVTTESNGITLFPRGVNELPPETTEIQPHPRGIELGILLQMLKESEVEQKGYTLYNFLHDKFCRVSPATASALCEKIGLTSRTKVADVDHPLAEKLRDYRAARKLGGTYGANWLAFIAPSGRIHAGWRQLGANSGRMACSRNSLAISAPSRAGRP